MKTCLKTLLLAGGLALGLAGVSVAADLKFMTGPQGGSWIPLGGQLKDLWEKAVPGLSVQSLPGAGIANVRGIQEGKADLGCAHPIPPAAPVTGKPPFNKPHDNICNVATLYPQYYQMVVTADSGITK